MEAHITNLISTSSTTENKENIELKATYSIESSCNEKLLNQTQDKKSQENALKDSNIKYSDHNVVTPSSSKSSLQDHFKKFKKARHEKFKYNRYLKNIKVNDRSTKEFQNDLRAKFVETAKKYLGVPYAKRSFYDYAFLQ